MAAFLASSLTASLVTAALISSDAGCAAAFFAGLGCLAPPPGDNGPAETGLDADEADRLGRDGVLVADWQSKSVTDLEVVDSWRGLGIGRRSKEGEKDGWWSRGSWGEGRGAVVAELGVEWPAASAMELDMLRSASARVCLERMTVGS